MSAPTFEALLDRLGRPYAAGRLAPPGSLDEALTATLRDYKLRVAKRYRTLPPSLAPMVLPEGTLWVSPKIDGELWFGWRKDGVAILCAPNGRMLHGVPVVAALDRALPAGESLVAGELFIAATADGPRPRVFHVARALRDPSQAARIGFKAFDVVTWDGEDLAREPYERRLAALSAGFPESGPASRVVTVPVDKRGALERYREWVESKRFEGLVARHDIAGVFKIKPEIGLDAVVIAWSDKLVGDRVELRELHVALMRDDGSFHVLGTVGSGLDDATRASLLARLNELAAPSGYRMANREGTLCRFVRPELVVELKCSDLMGADPGEPPTLRMTLDWSAERGWSAREAEPLPVMIGPVFVRVRDDKRPDRADIGLEQIRQVSPFEGEDDIAAPVARPPIVYPAGGPASAASAGSAQSAETQATRSEILVRRVWTKVTKGQTAVRKLVAWATHKAELDPRYPPFVVAFTDFSPGRKEPLQRELRVASCRATLDRHIAAWLDDNVKKGWTEVS